MDNNNVDKFLNEYHTLCLKYNLKIESCSCCSSPWLVKADDKAFDNLDVHILHLKKQGIQ